MGGCYTLPFVIHCIQNLDEKLSRCSQVPDFGYTSSCFVDDEALLALWGSDFQFEDKYKSVTKTQAEMGGVFAPGLAVRSGRENELPSKGCLDLEIKYLVGT